MADSQRVELCFAALKEVHKQSDFDRIIDQHFPIREPHVEPIQLTLDGKQSVAVQETPFVPSPQLLSSYQQTFSRANQDYRLTNTKNHKLEANFSMPAPQRNVVVSREERGKMLQEPIIVEDRQTIIMEQLRSGKIEATIPNMERTLFVNELSHLEQKEVAMENTLTLSDWKKLRNRFAK